MKNTPGLGGYLAAWAVSIVVFAYYASFFSVPFAAVGIPLVHLACRKADAQWVHVLVAGAVGLLPMIVFGFAGDPTALGAPLVPVATAIGRWSVVPLVDRRRRATGAMAVVV